MKELLMQHGLITEDDLKTKFKVEIYAKHIMGDVPFMTCMYNGERFSVSNYQLKRMRDSITAVKIVR